VLILAGAVICLLVGFAGYAWLFAERPAAQRLVFSILLALSVPLLLIALIAVVVGYTFMRGG
jgi:hypothetical protein